MLEDRAHPRETAPGGAQDREDGTLNGGEAKRDSSAARQAAPGRDGDRAATSLG